MKIRQILIVAAAVPAPSLSKSREQVLGELSAWQRNPVTADGVREVRGELGWVNARQVP